MLAELNKKINVSPCGADDGSVTLFVANSYPLVIGSKAGSLAVGADPLDSQNRQVLSFVNGSTSSTIDADMVTGGEIKGLQSFINNDLTSAMSQLGRIGVCVRERSEYAAEVGLESGRRCGNQYVQRLPRRWYHLQ
jgi:flagellar hook-associated protein 1 FlgK